MSVYEVELFKEEGFIRRKCTSCGRYFWTLDSSRNRCGDTPCDEYTFINNSPVKKPYSLDEMREAFLSFFEKNGHARLKRYPVVARWRDDILLTIASIADFQPWVTSGLVPPPANPLTISQPSIRFNDIDNVGRSGRHFTLFEMMAHHAFNSKDERIYWTNKTTKLCHELLVSLGIKAEKVSYIEEWWEGGGNGGECFEVIVEGLELATLVFMHYNIVNGRKEEMDLSIVDTGYGLERFTWISRGTPSAYEAVFGGFLEELKKIVGIKDIDKEILIQSAKLAGIMDIKTTKHLRDLRGKVAKNIGISVEDLEKQIVPLENIYAISDHTKCLAFMFADGIVPSNVRAGYLSRLILRRTLRSMRELGLHVPLTEIMAMQIKHLSKGVPEIMEHADYILEITALEEKRYGDTIKKGRAMVRNIIGSLKKEKKHDIPLEKLIDLYDSHGLPPLAVKEVSEDEGISLRIPDDFYTKVAERHEKVEPIAQTFRKEELDLKDVEKTDILYYDDYKLLNFNAKVMKIIDGKYVVLDKTAFYPTSGGQLHDKGKIKGCEVEDVFKQGDVIVHVVKGPGFKEGVVVDCEIDWGRRKQLAQHHTATHIINGVARELLGEHVWQAGAEKTENKGRLDITHFEQIGEDKRKEIEDRANEIVARNLKVESKIYGRNEAEEKFGFRLYQGGVVPGKELRVVKIGDLDVEACGGTHLNNTGEVRNIIITGSSKIQDGVVRLEYAADKAAEKHESQLKKEVKIVDAATVAFIEPITGPINLLPSGEEDLKKSAMIFSVPPSEVVGQIEKFGKEINENQPKINILEESLGRPQTNLRDAKEFQDLRNVVDVSSSDVHEATFKVWKEQRKEIEKLRKELAKVRVKTFGEFEKVGKYEFLCTEMEGGMKEMQKVALELLGDNRIIILFGVKEKISVIGIRGKNVPLDMRAIITQICNVIGGGGGGRPDFARGAGANKAKLREAMELAKKSIRKELAK